MLGAAWIHHPLPLFERRRGRIIGRDERVDGRPPLRDGREAGAPQGGATQDAEPALDQVQPTGVRRREVQVHARMAGEPVVVLRFVGAQVVKLGETRPSLTISGRHGRRATPARSSSVT